jgi:hypothetical protein
MLTLPACTQPKLTCLMGAAANGFVDMVKQLAEMGGKEYVMQTDRVRHTYIHTYIHTYNVMHTDRVRHTYIHRSTIASTPLR